MTKEPQVSASVNWPTESQLARGKSTPYADVWEGGKLSRVHFKPPAGLTDRPQTVNIQTQGYRAKVWIQVDGKDVLVEGKVAEPPGTR